MEYNILRSNGGPLGLVQETTYWISRGWKPLGAPFVDPNGFWVQAVIREKQ